MNKAELVSAVAEKAGLSKKDSEKAINAAFESITETLAAGEKVQLVGFGTFEVKERGEETGASGAEKSNAKREKSERRRERRGGQNDFADERAETKGRVRGGAKVANEVKPADVKGFGAERHVRVNVVRRKRKGAGFENFAGGLRVIFDDVVLEKRLRRRKEVKRRKNR